MYNILESRNRDYLSQNAKMLRVIPRGNRTRRLKPIDSRADMVWDDKNFVNSNLIRFKYPKRLWPNSKWPWPFRNIRSLGPVVVKEVELTSLNGVTYFQFATPSALVYPGDTLEFKPGSISISISS